MGQYHVIASKNYNWKMLDFEVDMKKVADYFKRGSIDIMEFEAIMEVCKHVVIYFFQNSHSEFIRQQTNKVTHDLAWIATFRAILHVFIDVPSCIT